MVESKLGIYKDAGWLQEKYWGEGLSLSLIARLIGVDPVTIFNWMNKHGIARRGNAVCREKHPRWQGGRKTGQGSKGGYITTLRPDHPNATTDGYIYEHRLVMERHLGRLLKAEEVVHHINGDGTDNRIENLMLFSSNAEHLAFHRARGNDARL